jgi:HlyD family secretion protein
VRRFPVRWLVVAVVVLGIAGLGYWGVKALSQGDGSGKLVMATKPVTRGDIEVVVRGWGMLQASEEQDVITGARGVVKEVSFQDGQQVFKGQVLATIDPGSLQLEIMQKEIRLDAKRLELAKAFGVMPEDVANVDPQAALTLRSPTQGRVTGLTVGAGSTASGVVCRVVDDQRLVIKLQLPKPLFDRIQVGTKTTFRPDRFDGEQPGIVIKADPNPIAGQDTYYYDTWVEMSNPGLLKVDDTGLLTFHSPQGEFQQKATIAAFGSDETVLAPFSGRVKRVLVKDGMMVSAGDPILEYEPGEALLQAMTGQIEFKQLLVELEDLRSQMQSLTVICPMDGYAFGRNIVPGQTVGMGQLVTRVSNFDSMNLMLRVDEIDVPKVTTGQTAKIIVWGPQGQQECEGQVSEIGAKGDPRDGMASFNIAVSLMNPGFLRPGMGAEAQIFVSKKSDVILCPVEALYKEDDKWLVDLKDEKGGRVPVEVQVGVMNDTFAEIIEGVTEGQEVVVGMSKEQPGQGGVVKPMF